MNTETLNYIYYGLGFIVFLYIIIHPTNLLIKTLLKHIFQGTSPVEDRTGRWIGSLERILYMIGILFNNWALITIVIAIKSISRYNKINKKNFAEQFLIGTLLSLLISIITTYLFIGLTNYYELTKFIQPFYTSIQSIKIVNF